MCGIAGILGRADSAVSDMQRMLDALTHRGPDGEGIHHDGHMILGHRRLSIIDLHGGRQPLRNAAGTVWLVCNGEIYNYREIRKQLEAEGYQFLTHSDCEVLIALYERYEDKLLAHVRGMFAFVLWDSRKQRLLAARDHLGQKPLYYVDDAQYFSCASEIKSLLALDPALREMDIEALDQYLALRLVAPPLSMFRRIRKLPPGSLLTLERGQRPKISEYWDLKFQPKLVGDEQSLTDELSSQIEEALRLHMVSDVPVGAFLSGGLDSSLLVAMLAERVGVRNLPTFTIGLPYRQFNEAPHARAVSIRYGTDHHEETLAPSLLALLPDLVWHLDEPSDPLSLCAYLIARLARRYVKVVIGGDGGDELFGGYDRYYGNLYAERYAHVPEALRHHVIGPTLSLIPSAGWYKSIGHQARWLHKLSFLSGATRYAASLTYFYFDQEARRELFTPEVTARLASTRAECAIEAPFDRLDSVAVDRMLYADTKVRLPDHPVMISDRMSMAHGVEVRSPFMDHRLAEFAARLPWTLKIRGRTQRYIQRKLASRYLPASVLNRPKQGFSSALPYILRNEYRALYQHFLTDSELVRAGILRLPPIQKVLHAHLSGKVDHGNRLWLLINAEVWYRMKILGQSRSDLRLALELGQAATA